MQNVIKKILSIVIIILIIQMFFLPIIKATTTKTVTIVLDPGHGGKMSGAVNNEKGLIERDLNLKIARYLKEYLNQYENINVLMTHNGIASDKDMELYERGMFARKNKADMLVSLHLNSTSGNVNVNGAEVFVTSSTVLPKYHEASAKFGNIVLSKLSKLGIKNNGVKTRLCNDVGPKWEYSDGSRADYYGVIRYSMKGDRRR